MCANGRPVRCFGAFFGCFFGAAFGRGRGAALGRGRGAGFGIVRAIVAVCDYAWGWFGGVPTLVSSIVRRGGFVV